MARNAKNTRMCAGCMKRADKSELVCIKKSLSDELSISCISRSGGRSVYLCRDEKCLDKAIKRKFISRGLRCEITADVCEKIRQMVKSENQE